MNEGRPLLRESGIALSSKLQWYPPPSRKYSRRELLAGQIIDVTAAIIGTLAGIALLYKSWDMGDTMKTKCGLFLHALGIHTMLWCSAACHDHAWDWKRARAFSSLDYLGITAKIAGSATPPLLQCDAYVTLAFVWFLGIAGTLLDVWKIIQRHLTVTPTYRCVLVGRFLLMGWCAPFSRAPWPCGLPVEYFYLYLIAGVLYTAGIPFFLMSFEFHMPVWHLFVIVGTGFMYSANFLYVAGGHLK